jgi:serine phosphatase RsbU (regulator of sigma subunit)
METLMTDGFGARSLSAKLGYLMTAVICGTVLALTVQSASKFSSYIQQNIEESSTALAERSASDMTTIMESWLSQMAVAVAKLPVASAGSAKDDAGLIAALRANKDIWAVNLYSIKDKQISLVRQATQPHQPKLSKTSGPPTNDKINHFLENSVSKLVTDPSQFIDGRFVENSTPDLNQPSVFMAIKLSIPGVENKYAVIAFVVDMTKLQLALPQSRSTLSYAIDSMGSPFVASDEVKISTKSAIKNHPLVQKALQRREPSGFISIFKDSSEREKIGSFAQMPGNMPFFVLIERDRAAAFQVISRVYISSALWGLLILLMATMASYMSAGTLTKNLRNLVGATSRIASGDFSVRLQPKTKDEVALLSHSVNNMASKIQSLMTSEVEKARFEKELETARLVQSTFFPKHDINRPHLTLTGSYQPATECGGDLWGHYTVRDNVELVFIADAMGHGAPAALVTAIAFAACQSVSTMLTEKNDLDASPVQLLNRLNKIIFDAVGGKITMTFFAAVIDFNDGTITFANAGHNFPFILTSNKDDPRLSAAAKKATNSSGVYPISLNLQGNPLGAGGDSQYSEKQLRLVAGDKIIFFTDGLIENSRQGNAPLGRKSLIELACKIGQKDPAMIKTELEQAGAEIFGSGNLTDDVTIVVAEISKNWVAVKSPIVKTREAKKDVMDLSFEGSTLSLQIVPPPPPVPLHKITMDSSSAASTEVKTTPQFDLSFAVTTEPQSTPVAVNPPQASVDLGSTVFDLGDSFDFGANQNQEPEILPPGFKKRLPSTG